MSSEVHKYIEEALNKNKNLFNAQVLDFPNDKTIDKSHRNPPESLSLGPGDLALRSQHQSHQDGRGCAECVSHEATWCSGCLCDIGVADAQRCHERGHEGLGYQRRRHVLHYRHRCRAASLSHARA